MDYATQWRQNENRYEQNGYDGDASGIRVALGPQRPRLVISAVHATNHVRDGKLKWADRGTGGLAELLATSLGATSVTAATGRAGDANHDAAHPAKDTLEGLRPQFILDLHGMKDRPDHPVQVDIGTGHGLTPPGLEQALREHLTASTGALFTGGRKPTTVTAWAQAHGIPALQLEIAASYRPPIADDDALRSFASALISAVNDAGWRH